MIFPNQQNIKTRIILLFRKHSVLTVAEAMDLLIRNGEPCTIQAVYKEFRSLVADDIVQKVGKSYMLNAAWVLELQQFSNRLVRSVFSEQVGKFLLAGQGKKQVWNFNSLMDLNDFWAHLDLYIVRNHDQKRVLAWNPYVWFFLFHRETEEKFLKSLRVLGGDFVVIVGGDNFLNRTAREFYHRNNVTYSYNPDPFRGQMDTYLNILGDYIVTVKMAKPIHEKMDTLYRTTKSMADISIPDITEIFIREGQSRLTLELNPKKAARLRRQFSTHFGEEF